MCQRNGPAGCGVGRVVTSTTMEKANATPEIAQACYIAEAQGVLLQQQWLK